MVSGAAFAMLTAMKLPQSKAMADVLYFGNATVLLTHQIDAAFWREWELFRIPGGLEVFLLLNLPIVLLVLLGAHALAASGQSRRSQILSWGLVGCGGFAAAIHAFFLLRGDVRFHGSVSIGLLVATAILSPAQALCLWRRGQRGG
jgi:hypothetical protein